ncbi:hypothetical protein [Helicobacter pylori]|uniref:hypothetical protein n=1 Tax=Helicobacter pylori TaxID=210 RepID=UPI000EB12C2D|nr:hypothetical protein [Helicobacter pylori]
MRQKNETATSFKELKEITQIMQAQKRSAQINANANASEIAHKSALTPKARVHAKKGALKPPTKRAFSERQITTIRDNSQETKQANQQGDNANAFKGDEANQRGQQ